MTGSRSRTQLLVKRFILTIVIIFRKLVSIYFFSFRVTCDGVGDIIFVGNERLRGRRVLLQSNMKYDMDARKDLLAHIALNFGTMSNVGVGSSPR